MDQTEKQDRAAKLQATADHLRPPMQAMLDFVVQGAKTAATLGGNEDEIWAATVINAAEGLQLDLEHPGQMGAAMIVAEVVMEQAGFER